MVRNHSLHRDAADERARLAKLAKLAREITQDLAEKHAADLAAELAEHENVVREREREREDRRHGHLVQQPDEYRDSYGELMPNEDIAVDGLW